MGHKVVAIIKQHPHIQKILSEVEHGKTHFDQRREFLQKQMDDLNKESSKSLDVHKERLNHYLVEVGAMPEDYTPEKWHTHIDDDLGVVLLCDGDHKKPSVQAILEGLLFQ